MSADAVKQTSARPARRSSSFLKNVTSSWAGLLTNIVVSFFLAPYVVHSLGNVYYGIWALVNQSTGYLWLFDFGVRESVVKFVAQHHAAGEKEELVSLVNTAVAVYSAIGVLALVACAGLAFALPHFFNIPADAVTSARVTLVLTGATIAQAFAFNVYIGVMMGIQRYYLVPRLGVVFTLIRTGLTVALLWAGQGIIALSALNLVTNLVMNLLVYRLSLKHVPYLAPRLSFPSREHLRRIVGYGKYVLITNIGEKVMYSSDAVIIAAALPVSTLAFYAVAGTLVTYLNRFIATMTVVLNPMSSSLAAQSNTAGLGRLFLTSSKAAVLIGVPICTVFIILGERFIDIWMGPSFGPVSGPILVVLAVTYLVGLPYHTITGVLLGLGRHPITARARIVEAVSKIILAILLVRQVGLIGVAIATLVPHAIVVLTVLPPAITRILQVRLVTYYFSTYVRPLLAALPFWVACILIDRVFAPSTLIGFGALLVVALLTYVAPCWYFALSQDERDWAWARFGRGRSSSVPV